MIKVSGYRYEYKLDEPLSISFHTWYYRENVIVKLEYDNYCGYGEAVPFKGITGDSQDEVIEELRSIKEINLDPQNADFETFHKYLRDIGLKSTTLYAAFDFAYHDFLGKMKNIPSYKLYSDTVNHVPNSVTVFLKDSVEETAIEAKRIIKEYPHLKVMKIKLKGKGDIERCKAIKNVVKKDLSFMLDANQGFNDPKEAVETINELSSILGNIVLVEEPCPKGKIEKLKYVKDNISCTKIFADESAVDIDDVKKIIKVEAADGINIKLQKTGGIWPARLIAEECRENGLEVMVGSMLEGPLAIAAGVHFAAATDNVILTDLDMDLDMKKHTGTVIEFNDGTRSPNNFYGLGIEFDKNLIDKLKTNGILRFKEI
jgi:L-Ala-D/L-Glu epimerase